MVGRAAAHVHIHVHTDAHGSRSRHPRSGTISIVLIGVGRCGCRSGCYGGLCGLRDDALGSLASADRGMSLDQLCMYPLRDAAHIVLLPSGGVNCCGIMLRLRSGW